MSAIVEHFVRTPDGARLHVLERGAGPALVALHGIPEDHATFEPILPALEPVARVWLPDLRGFGLSSQAPAAGRLDFARLAADLGIVLEQLGIESPVLLGHDAGGYVAMEYAHRHPERLRGLILVNTTWRRVRLSGSPQMLLFGLPVVGALFVRWLGGRMADLALRLGHANSATIDPRHLERCRLIASSSRQAIADLYESNRRTAIAKRLSPPPPPQPIELPALIVWGDRDPFLHPELASWLAQMLPRSRLERLPDAGHFPHQERPGEVAAAIGRFLAELPVQSGCTFESTNSATSPTLASEA